MVLEAGSLELRLLWHECRNGVIASESFLNIDNPGAKITLLQALYCFGLLLPARNATDSGRIEVVAIAFTHPSTELLLHVVSKHEGATAIAVGFGSKQQQ